jgi:hypothetical protein
MRNRYAASAAAAAVGTLLATTGLFPALAAPGTVHAAPGSAGTWGKAIAVPGLARLNTGKNAEITEVSCAAPGDCEAGGWYTVGESTQALLVGERDGRWGKPGEIAGLAKLNTADDAFVQAISCPGAGSCSAVGEYTTKQDEALPAQVFAVTQTHGVWGKAIEVPGLSRLNVGPAAGGGPATVDAVSCGAPGDCSAGGNYYASDSSVQAFVVTQTNGSWGKAIEVPGLARLNVGPDAEVKSVSCAAPGDCVAGGYYASTHQTENSVNFQAFVVTQANGVWGKAIEVPGSGKLDSGGDAGVTSVSCAAPGDCVAGGSYLTRDDDYQAFVVSLTSGVWGKAIEVPGSARLNAGGLAGIDSVSCAKPGDCSAGGSYANARERAQALVVTQTNGVWANATEVPGSARLNARGADIDSVSCTEPADCSAGGYYTDGHGKMQALVVTQTDGRWGAAIEVPGSGRLNTGGQAVVASVSCATPGHCGAGGYYAPGTPKENHTQAFVVAETGR